MLAISAPSILRQKKPIVLVGLQTIYDRAPSCNFLQTTSVQRIKFFKLLVPTIERICYRMDIALMTSSYDRRAYQNLLIYPESKALYHTHPEPHPPSFSENTYLKLIFSKRNVFGGSVLFLLTHSFLLPTW
jgi:hypothetical protein